MVISEGAFSSTTSFPLSQGKISVKPNARDEYHLGEVGVALSNSCERDMCSLGGFHCAIASIVSRKPTRALLVPGSFVFYLLEWIGDFFTAINRRDEY